MYPTQRQISTNAGDYGLADLTLTDQYQPRSSGLPTFLQHGCNMCAQLWNHCAERPERSLAKVTFSIHLKAEYLGSRSAMRCSLCSVISNAVDAAEECIDEWPVESVSLHSSSVGGPLDMVVWLINGDTMSFELYTHRGRYPSSPSLQRTYDAVKTSPPSGQVLGLLDQYRKTPIRPRVSLSRANG
jgi:hypothetical protein